MSQNNPKIIYKKNPSKPINLSHSRSISTIPNHKKSITFMPKFLLKTLHRRKRSVSNSTTFNGNKSLKEPGPKNGVKDEKITKIDRHVQGNHQLMQLIPSVSRRVTSIMSFMFRKDKRREQEQCKDHHKLRNSSKKSISNEVHSGSSKNCKFGGVSNVVTVAELRRLKSENQSKENVEPKGGLKMKRIIKMKSREKEKVEKRFELCKKKILMGDKCRPLHGDLHYDKNGVLVPGDFT